jgi:cell volume regulation protein A
MSWPEALLLGAATAPTDAAAISVLLRVTSATAPSRVIAALEVESGVNDPMSVFLTVSLVEWMAQPDSIGPGHAILMLVEEMGGGMAIGLAGGYALLWVFRKLHTERSVFPTLALGGALTIFGGAQVVGASGFLAVYLAGLIAGNFEHQADQPVKRFFGTLGWLAQIALFLMLGLLVEPHELPPLILPALAMAAVLIFLARPAAVGACVLPFRWTIPEAAFISWAGLRGAVPIYLTIIPLLAGLSSGGTLFKVVFVIVIVSVAVQGWTITLAARLLGMPEAERAARVSDSD